MTDCVYKMLNKRFKFAGDIFDKLIALGWETDTAESLLNSITDADVVEVVRCGQCKHHKTNPNNLHGGWCRYSNCANIYNYCSYGAKMDKEETV